MYTFKKLNFKPDVELGVGVRRRHGQDHQADQGVERPEGDRPPHAHPVGSRAIPQRKHALHRSVSAMTTKHLTNLCFECFI